MDVTEAAAILGRNPSRAAVILDFDGTLSEIAPTPEAAAPVPGALQAVEGLASRIGLVAIVSGRQAADVRDRLGAAGVRYLGLYGLEDADRRVSPSVAPPGLLAELRTAVAAVPGALVEAKGSNVAVHYRLAADPSEAGRRLGEVMADLAQRHGLRVLPGKRVLELAPAGAPTKGEAVRRLLDEVGATAAGYAGDDIADLEAFAALIEARDGPGPLAETIRIAVRSGETPATVTAAADLVLAGPRQLVRLLNAIAS